LFAVQGLAVGRRDREQVAEIGALARGRDLAGRDRFLPGGAAGGEEEEHERLTFDDVRGSAAAVPRTLDALHRTVGRDPDFHRVTWRFGR